MTGMTAWLSEKEEMLLFARVRDGDAQAAELLFEPYHALIGSLALRMKKGSSALDVEELIQAGYVGMLRAAKRYDPAQSVRFATYAVPWAIGEMKKALRKALDATGAYDRQRQIARQEGIFYAQFGRSPNAQELAQACGMSDWELVCAVTASTPASLDASFTDDDQTTLEERLEGGKINMEAVDLRFALDRLDEEARKLILLRYFRDQTQKEAAGILGKSQAQISRIESRALDTLRTFLKQE